MKTEIRLSNEPLRKMTSARLTNRQYQALQRYCDQWNLTIADAIRIHIKEIINPKSK